MPETLKFVVVWSVLLLFVIGAVAFNVWVIRRNRHNAVVHPERLPRGRRLAARAAVWAALSGALTIYAGVEGWWPVALLGLLSTGGFCWMTYRGFTDPAYRA